MKSVFSGVLALILLVACSAEPEAPKAPLVTVEGDLITLAEPEKARFLQLAEVGAGQDEAQRLAGRLIWNEDRTVRVYPQLAGRVLSVKAELGQQVSRGQILATLSSADFGLAEVALHKAQADDDLAQKALARSKVLWEAEVIAGKDWEQAQADARKARSELERSRQQIQALGGVNQVGEYSVKSPMTGLLVARNINPGQEFRPDQGNTPLFVVADADQLWVQLDATENELSGLRPGLRLMLETKAYPGVRFPGVVRHVADFVDPDTRTIRVRGEVPNKDHRLKAEMFVTAVLDLPPRPSIRVPAAAVVLMGATRYVFVAAGEGRYQRREVKVGQELDGRLEILEGLKAGEKVVVEGNLYLTRYFKPVPRS